MIEVVDNVRFIMPRSREYQFAAMAVVQHFVAGFKNKMTALDVSGGTATYALRYCLDMPLEDLEFFVAPKFGSTGKPCVQLDLVQMPVEFLDDVTMLVDLSDERLDSMRDSGKHIAQICGLLCGVLTQPLPKVRRVGIRRDKCYKWLESPTCADLLALGDEEITGIVAWRGEATYLAAAMGLGVVELDSAAYPNWMTKWRCRLYRRVVIAGSAPDSAEELLIAEARRSVELTLSKIVELCGSTISEDK